MDEFEAAVLEVLKARPGLTRERIAAAAHVPGGEELRNRMDELCEKGLAHKVQDKYYPGKRLAY